MTETEEKEKKRISLKIKWPPIKRPHFSFKAWKTKIFWKRFALVCLVLMVLGGGVAIGTLKAILQNLPSIQALETFEPPITTYIYADNGEVIGQFATERRVEVSFEEIPHYLIKAIIATEDPRFYRHHGIDFLGILRAIREDLRLVRRSGRLHGGSTISQQLARELFLHRRQTLRRKIKELILALQIEKRYSKKQILTMYCNQFNLGHGAYGVEAAAQLYFGKHVSELTLPEVALLAGILRGPAIYSPYRHPERTLRRRNHVLNRMVEEGFLTPEQAEKAKQTPLNVLPLHRMDSEFAAYFKEEVRRYLEKTYGVDALYGGGLKVYTTLNIDYQKYAEEALRKQLRVLDKRAGWRNDKRNLASEGVEDVDSYEGKDLITWLRPEFKIGDVVEAVVLEVTRRKAKLKIKDYQGEMSNQGIGWTKTNNLTRLIKRGDIIQVEIKKIDEENKLIQASLDQEPLIEGAFLAIEPQTGQVKAMIGGYSFRRSQWNRATQALRQSGSVIKPILYTAALENGYTPASRIVDEPTEFFDEWSDEPYAPNNYDRRYKGAVTLRMGLEQSRNIVTAKLLEYISPQRGVEYCKKFGITSPVYPYLSLALGAFEVRLWEIVSAFSTFANHGVRVHPYFITRIEDKDGHVLEEAKLEKDEVISPQIAFMMTYLMKGVIERGTGVAASYLLRDIDLAGKTGTTDEYTDAWFVGFSPLLCAGVWIGHDTKITIGERQTGAVAALPIWIEFFQKIIDSEKKLAEENDQEFKREEFLVPPNLSFVEIDRKTGLLATPACLWPFREVFLPGTEPSRFCTLEDHLLTFDYYNQTKVEH